MRLGGLSKAMAFEWAHRFNFYNLLLRKNLFARNFESVDFCCVVLDARANKGLGDLKRL